jgi:hypothetical protein
LFRGLPARIPAAIDPSRKRIATLGDTTRGNASDIEIAKLRF